jgi:lipopolysaccharide transport system permease protein
MIVYARGHLAAFGEMVRYLAHHWRLTWELAKREITDRYSGQVFGMLWAVGHPLAMMSVYILLFGYVLKLRIGGTPDLPLDFTTYMLAGLIPWLGFQEAMNKGVVAITSNASLVKQVVFPLEVLPLKGILAAMVTQAITTVILISYVLITNGGLPWTYALLPILWLLQFLAMGGVCFLLAAIGAYIRDVKELLQLFSVVGIYIMPTVYLPAWVPAPLRPLLYLNPFSYLVWCYQDACYFGRIEHPFAWSVFSIGSVSIFYLGYRCFFRCKVCFGSVL